ncbi:hypothetical protein IWZ03DRAFT_391189 [Phyllosticta citriasiana]|uniref:Uncharacterized protein n=1 Tax=Phyllosticta citriasiana TaxID=595635 RepID=A0ABR1K7B1_9PEZI
MTPGVEEGREPRHARMNVGEAYLTYLFIWTQVLLQTPPLPPVPWTGPTTVSYQRSARVLHSLRRVGRVVVLLSGPMTLLVVGVTRAKNNIHLTKSSNAITMRDSTRLLTQLESQGLGRMGCAVGEGGVGRSAILGAPSRLTYRIVRITIGRAPCLSPARLTSATSKAMLDP